MKKILWLISFAAVVTNAAERENVEHTYNWRRFYRDALCYCAFLKQHAKKISDTRKLFYHIELPNMQVPLPGGGFQNPLDCWHFYLHCLPSGRLLLSYQKIASPTPIIQHPQIDSFCYPDFRSVPQFSPDYKFFCWKNQTDDLKLYALNDSMNPDTCKVLKVLKIPDIIHSYFSPDSNFLVVHQGPPSLDRVNLFNVHDAAIQPCQQIPLKTFRDSITFSSDSSLIARINNNIVEFLSSDGAVQAAIPLSPIFQEDGIEYCTFAKFSPDNKLLVVVVYSMQYMEDSHAIMHVMDVETKRCKKIIHFGYRVAGIKFSPLYATKPIFAISSSRGLTFFDNNGEQVAVLRGSFENMVFSPRGDKLYTLQHRDIYEYDLNEYNYSNDISDGAVEEKKS